jgi:hypothetical protein
MLCLLSFSTKNVSSGFTDTGNVTGTRLTAGSHVAVTVVSFAIVSFPLLAV